MESSQSNKVITKFQRFEFFLGIIHRMLIGFVTIYVTWLSLQRLKIGDVPWHALFCTVGFNFLMAEGILSYYKGNSPTYGCCRSGKVGLHIGLQLSGSLLGITGVIIRMAMETIHFTTLHGKLGLVAFVLCLLSLLFGLSALYSIKMKDWLRPIFNKTFHGVLGILCYTIAIVCLFFGFETNVFNMISPLKNESSINSTFLLKVATMVSLIITIYGPLASAIKNISYSLK